MIRYIFKRVFIGLDILLFSKRKSIKRQNITKLIW